MCVHEPCPKRLSRCPSVSDRHTPPTQFNASCPLGIGLHLQWMLFSVELFLHQRDSLLKRIFRMFVSSSRFVESHFFVEPSLRRAIFVELVLKVPSSGELLHRPASLNQPLHRRASPLDRCPKLRRELIRTSARMVWKIQLFGYSLGKARSSLQDKRASVAREKRKMFFGIFRKSETICSFVQARWVVLKGRLVKFT